MGLTPATSLSQWQLRPPPLIAWATAFAVAIWACTAGGEVIPAACFTSHMVLQQGTALPVWGMAEPGERVEVEFAGARAAERRMRPAAGRSRWRHRQPVASRARS